ncbi:MAG: hypothetical protein J2O48_07950, partial [Solirubrobacterales bacterium]|nr:hypothetical protein [Solirubrobacterales bacterium]
KRAVALVKVAREVAAGRVDLAAPGPDWERLARIPEIGSWTLEMTALTGCGRLDQLPAGDLGFIKLVGRLASGGDPKARASEQEVRDLFARFGRWRGLAGAYALRAAGVSKSPVLR